MRKGELFALVLGGQCSQQQTSEFADHGPGGCQAGVEPRPHLSTLRDAALTIREDSAAGGRAVGALEGLAVTSRNLPHPGVAISRARQEDRCPRVPFHPLGRDKGSTGVLLTPSHLGVCPREPHQALPASESVSGDIPGDRPRHPCCPLGEHWLRAGLIYSRRHGP